MRPPVLFLIPVILLASAAAGCAPTRLTLRNPYTGNVGECQPDPAISWDTAVAIEICTQRYESLGYQPVGTY